MRSPRKLALMVAISAICHGVAFTGLALIEPAPRPRGGGDLIEISIEPAAPPANIAAEPPSRAPELAAAPIVRAPPLVAPAADLVRPAANIPPRAPRRTANPERPAANIPPDGSVPNSVPVPTRPSSLLSMRSVAAERPAGLRAPALGLDLSPRRAAAAVAPIDPARDALSPLTLPDAPHIPGPRVARADGPMIADGNGTFRFDHPGFTAKVARDGRVALKDKPSFQPFVQGPCLECVTRDLSKYADDPSSGRVIDIMALLPKVGVRFDITDYVMRKIGDDPYNHAKAKFLDDTRDRREQMWHAESGERMREALQTLPAQLRTIWSHTAWTPAERRRVLFDLWDECAETGSPDRVRLGTQIRVSITSFIRRRLPADSADAYTEAELRALNERRTSKSEFAPYRPAGGD